MSTKFFQSFISKLNLSKDKIPYYIIVVLLFLALTNYQTTPPQTPVTNVNVSPTTTVVVLNPSTSSNPEKASFKIESTHPADNAKSLISDTRSNVSITTDREISKSDILGLELKVTPEMTFNKVVHINKRTIYFVPLEKWKNNTKYSLSVLLYGKRIHYFSFTTTNIPDKSEMKIDLGP
jgi:hypothetical protein